MINKLQPVKWIIIPAMIVLVQIVLNASGAFGTEFGMWAFIAISAAILLVWRNRLGKLILPLTRGGIANMETMDRSDRRFAFLSMAAPFAVLLSVQLLILLLAVIDPPLIQRNSGTLWTVFAITAIGSYRISLYASCWVVTHSIRWRRILKEHPLLPPAQ